MPILVAQSAAAADCLADRPVELSLLPRTAATGRSAQPDFVARLTRVNGSISIASGTHERIQEQPAVLEDLATIKTWMNAWCEIRFSDVIVRCWQQTEITVDLRQESLRVHRGNAIIRKHGNAGELSIKAGDRRFALQDGVLKVECRADRVSVLN